MDNEINRQEMERALKLLLKPEAVTELRILGVAPYGNTHAGFFDADHRDLLVEEALKFNGKAEGIYIIPNELHPGMIARCANYTKRIFGGDEGLSSDSDIISRRWLMSDFDPRRPSHISSTDKEKQLALDAARRCFRGYVKRGWDEPIVGDSGNGFHLLWKYLTENTDEAKEQIKGLLEAIRDEFETADVKVDTNVFNAARIWKLYGTLAAKGDDYQSTDPDKSRPHRMSKLIYVPKALEA